MLTLCFGSCECCDKHENVYFWHSFHSVEYISSDRIVELI